MTEYDLSEKARACVAEAARKISTKTGPGELAWIMASMRPSAASASEVLGIHVARKIDRLTEQERRGLQRQVRDLLPVGSANAKPKGISESIMQFGSSWFLNNELKADYDRCIGPAPSFVPRVARQHYNVGDF